MNNENQNLNSDVTSNLNNLTQTDFNPNNLVNNDNNLGSSEQQNNNIDNTIDKQNFEQPNGNSAILYDTSAHINNVQPQKKQTKKATIKISYELKTAIIILVILLAFIIFIPKIFDLFY